MATYLLLNQDNIVVNAIEYDGVSDYPLEEAWSLVLFDEEVRPWIGWTFNNGEWIMPEPVTAPVDHVKDAAIEKLSALGLTQEEINALISR